MTAAGAQVICCSSWLESMWSAPTSASPALSYRKHCSSTRVYCRTPVAGLCSTPNGLFGHRAGQRAHRLQPGLAERVAGARLGCGAGAIRRRRGSHRAGSASRLSSASAAVLPSLHHAHGWLDGEGVLRHWLQQHKDREWMDSWLGAERCTAACCSPSAPLCSESCAGDDL